MVTLLVLNTVLAVVSIVFAVVAAVRPAALSRTRTPTAGERFYGWMYAARAVPLGSVAAILPLTSPGPACAAVLLAAGCAQVADAGIGLSRREWGMTAGGTILAATHTITAVALW